jgi:hypothetical protein
LLCRYFVVKAEHSCRFYVAFLSHFYCTYIVCRYVVAHFGPRYVRSPGLLRDRASTSLSIKGCHSPGSQRSTNRSGRISPRKQTHEPTTPSRIQVQAFTRAALIFDFRLSFNDRPNLYTVTNLQGPGCLQAHTMTGTPESPEEILASLVPVSLLNISICCQGFPRAVPNRIPSDGKERMPPANQQP